MDHKDVTVVIPTKNRYESTLPMTLMSVINQTVLPKKIIIVDDSDDGYRTDLRGVWLYKTIFKTMDLKNIQWEVAFGPRKGVAWCHQIGLDKSETEWVWRLDDDNIAEPNVLQELLRTGEDKTTSPLPVGAVAGLVIDPHNILETIPIIASNKIEDWELSLNIQWFRQGHRGNYSVDHLYSSFLYRRRAGSHGFPKDLSPVSHTEETQFSFGMKLSGWDLIINPTVTTWHYRNSSGGIRTYTDGSLWAHDSYKFKEWLKTHGISLKKYRIVILDNGLGDHICFHKILPEIRGKYHDHTIVISCCYPEVFQDEPDIKIISIADAQVFMGINVEGYNIYKFMNDHQWSGSIVDAFRKLYGLTA